MSEPLVWTPIPVDERDEKESAPFPRRERALINPASITEDDIVVQRGFCLTDALTGLPALRALYRWSGRKGRLVLVAHPVIGRWLCSWGVVDAVCSTGNVRASRPKSTGHVAFDLLGHGPDDREALRARGAHTVIGFADADGDGPRWEDHEHEVLRWVRLVHSVGAEAHVSDLALQPRPEHTDDLRFFASKQRPGFVIIHPGAATGARRWGAHRWIAVGRSLCADGRRIVVTGNREDRSLCAEVTAGITDVVAGAAGRVIDLSGQLRLADLTHMVAAAALVLSTDTGISHLATATVTSSVTLFGPVPPSEGRPLLDPDLHTVLWAGDHPDSRGDPHAATIDPRLDRLQPLHVVQAARVQLARRRPATHRYQHRQQGGSCAG